MANQPNIAVIQMHSQVLSGTIPNLGSSGLSILITCSSLVCEGELAARSLAYNKVPLQDSDKRQVARESKSLKVGNVGQGPDTT